MLSKADLLKQKTKDIPVDGGIVRITALTADYFATLRGRELKGAELFEVIAKSIVNENNETFLTSEEVGMIAMATLEQIIEGIFSFNALGKKAVEDAKNDLKKTDDLIMNSAGHWERPQ